jgi:phosphoribosylformylglycinamidine synthase
VGGEVNFHPAYDGNILVNAMTVGVAETDKIFYCAASGVGNSIVYVGSKTGRDGIHGATMASADFGEDSEEKRPTVQVGDPFTEKLLIEACLELMATDAIVAIQDMGAAGLTSSSVEMASKGGCGIRLNMNAVPQRETGMTPYEMMLSESQERMLMVLKPGKEAMAEAIFKKWELDFAVIGEVTEGGHMVLEWNGDVVADIPLGPLAEDAPEYERPYLSPADYKAWAKVPALGDVPESTDIGADLVKLMGSPDIASRRWIWEQYDNKVGGDTVQAPGGDAAVVRVHGSAKALAITTDCTPRYCYADPYEGGKQAVAETYRNISAVGATPLAITNCLNFANPQRPEIMAQIVHALGGMAEACRALDYPIVSGNVSLYNESKATGGGSAILPTPAIGGVGLMADWTKAVGVAFCTEGDGIWVIGGEGTHLGQSIWLREVHGREAGAPPPVELAAERARAEQVRWLIDIGKAKSVHDVSDGGLLVAIVEMALAGRIGCTLTIDLTTARSFGEDQGRYVVTAAAGEVIENGVQIGTVGGNSVAGVPLETLRTAHEGFLPALMNN